MKSIQFFISIFALLILLNEYSSLNAQWLPDGNAVCTYAGSQNIPYIVSDGSGGAIIIWTDARNWIPPILNYDVYAQRIDGKGTALWTPNGLVLCSASENQIVTSVISDKHGGAIVFWNDGRNNALYSGYDVYAQGVTHYGLKWSVNGVPVYADSGRKYNATAIEDGLGGAFFTIQDISNLDIYAQHIDSGGNLLWPSAGVAVCDTINAQVLPSIVNDETGGIIVTWSDFRSSSNDIYAQRIASDGNATWIKNGIPVCSTSSTQDNPKSTTDQTGGAIIAWQQYDATGDIYAQRIDEDGNILWDTNGIPVCTESGDQTLYGIVSDSSGGSIITWRDTRNGDYDVYAQRINSEGIIQWESGGLAIGTGSGDQTEPRILMDDSGFAIFVWINNQDIYAQKIDLDGNSLWTTGGIAICTATGDQSNAVVTTDSAKGAIVAWRDKRTEDDIYAQRIMKTGNTGIPPTPTILSIVDVPNDQGGSVNIQWERSYIDVTPDNDISHYSIWMRIVLEPGDPPEYAWDWIEDIPAAQFQYYSEAVPTLYDSINSTTAWHVFMITAHTKDSTEFYESEVDSGYSVDNLPPLPPQGLMAAVVDENVQLNWNASPETDLRYYIIYRDDNKYDSTSQESYTDNDVEIGQTYAYRLIAMDVHGNESDFSDEVITVISSVQNENGLEIPINFDLSQNYPNPFNPETIISWQLPVGSYVDLSIYNILGEKLITLVSEDKQPGYYSVKWDAAEYTSGIYFYCIQAGDFIQTKRMLLIK